MNKHFYQKWIASALAIILFFGLFAGVNQAKAEAALNVNAEGAILVDADNRESFISKKMLIVY